MGEPNLPQQLEDTQGCLVVVLVALALVAAIAVRGWSRG